MTLNAAFERQLSNMTRTRALCTRQKQNDLRSSSGNLGSLVVLSALEQRVELANKPRRNAQREVRVLQRVGDVLNYVVLLHAHRQHLANVIE